MADIDVYPTALEDAVCTLCGAFIAHFVDSDGQLTPVMHEAPCGRQCFGGGVSREMYLIGHVHRGDMCPCMSDEEDEN